MLRRSIAAIALCAGFFLAPQAATAGEVASGDYYENTATATSAACTAQGCTIYLPFGAATAGKLVRITSIDCLAQSTGPVDYAQYYLTDSALGLNPRRNHSLAIIPTTKAGIFAFHDQVDYRVAGGPPRHLAVTIQGGGSSVWLQIQCAVTGRIEAQ